MNLVQIFLGRWEGGGGKFHLTKPWLVFRPLSPQYSLLPNISFVSRGGVGIPLIKVKSKFSLATPQKSLTSSSLAKIDDAQIINHYGVNVTRNRSYHGPRI